MSILDPVKNFANVEVSTTFDASETTITLSGGEGAKLPDPATDGAFNLVWFDATSFPNVFDDPKKEIVRVTARTIDSLTVTRGQEATSATTKNTAGVQYRMILTPTKKMINDIEDLIQIEDLSDQLNGVNRVFNIDFSYVSGKILLLGSDFPTIYRSTGVTPDFTESADKEITIDSALPAPASDHTLRIVYVKKLF